MKQVTSCGVIVTDGRELLLGHATHSPRWDIPKGIADPGESFLAAAVRELAEETGLEVSADALRDLGVHAYRPGKDLALYVWTPRVRPRIEDLVCRSTFAMPGGRMVPEFDRFGWFAWDAALTKVGKNLARLLAAVRDEAVAGLGNPAANE